MEARAGIEPAHKGFADLVKLRSKRQDFKGLASYND